MKNFFDKMKNYSFWVSFSGALIILLNAFGRIFGWQIENQIVEDCIMSIAGILVVFGIVTMDNGGDGGQTTDENEEKDQTEENEDECQIDEEKENSEEKNEDKDVVDEMNKKSN